MRQPAPHILNDVAAKKPRVGEVEVALGEHRFVGRDEDHLGIEIGANDNMIIQHRPSWARYD